MLPINVLKSPHRNMYMHFEVGIHCWILLSSFSNAQYCNDKVVKQFMLMHIYRMDFGQSTYPVYIHCLDTLSMYTAYVHCDMLVVYKWQMVSCRLSVS